ncbi:toprim domain-containing protein [Streptomyces sp. cg35]|uniref:toprim domain-containing protein n=1 Tax=Streptomyces sp. cg35 TaxID=3421650 RepID=UPI003D17E860
MRAELDELTALPEGHKEQIAHDVLDSLGITLIRQQKDELIHACPVSDYHSDQERNPTAALNASNLMWHCLGCGAGGTVLWLIATLRNVTIEQALQWLHGEAGLARVMELPDLLALFESLYKEKDKRAPLPVYSPRMLQRWEEQGIPDYILDGRKIPITTAVAKGICTDPDGFVGPPESRVRTGPRAVIPHWWDGKLVGWQSRRLPGADPKAPKYLSTPGFPREETVFDHQPHLDTIIVVESPMSALRHRHHQALSATFGADVTDEQIRILAQGRKKVIWWPDNDEAGWKMASGRTFKNRFYPGAAERASRYCQNWVVQNPFAADPADMSDEMVAAVLAECVVPWPIWQRPTQLYCHLCLQTNHDGPCRP